MHAQERLAFTHPAQLLVSPPSFVDLPKLKRGDAVSVISPSAQVVPLFPHVYEAGVRRLQEDFGLKIVEHKHTKIASSSLRDRAQDVMAAFKNPDTKAIFAVIGGDEQIKIIPFLDPTVISKNPKPFFGHSDNTNLCNYLWCLGIPSFYGGSILCQFGFQSEIPSLTKKFIEIALFKGGKVALEEAEEFSEKENAYWSNPDTKERRLFEKSPGWDWNGNVPAEGILWGGCVEIVNRMLMKTDYARIPSPKALTKTILCLETSEVIPDSYFVGSVLEELGDRGYFEMFQGVLFGRAKTWYIGGCGQPTDELRQAYRLAQRETVIKTVRRFNEHIPIVSGLDFGHTDPQIPLPFGKMAWINPSNRSIEVNF